LAHLVPILTLHFIQRPWQLPLLKQQIAHHHNFKSPPLATATIFTAFLAV